VKCCTTAKSANFLPNWRPLERNHPPDTAVDVDRLLGTIRIGHTLTRMGAERLWHLFHTEPYVHALGALNVNQAVQQLQAGLKAIYLSGWQERHPHHHQIQRLKKSVSMKFLAARLWDVIFTSETTIFLPARRLVKAALESVRKMTPTVKRQRSCRMTTTWRGRRSQHRFRPMSRLAQGTRA